MTSNGERRNFTLPARARVSGDVLAPFGRNVVLYLQGTYCECVRYFEEKS